MVHRVPFRSCGYLPLACLALPPLEAMAERSLDDRDLALAGPPVFPPFLPRVRPAPDRFPDFLVDPDFLLGIVCYPKNVFFCLELLLCSFCCVLRYALSTFLSSLCSSAKRVSIGII